MKFMIETNSLSGPSERATHARAENSSVSRDVTRGAERRSARRGLAGKAIAMLFAVAILSLL